MLKAFETTLQAMESNSEKFSEIYPEYANDIQLSAHKRDPQLERIFEGVAYLAVDIQENTDRCVSTLSEQLLEVFHPESLQPLPARTVLHLNPKPYGCRSATFLPKGALFHWKDRDENKDYRFVSCIDTWLCPFNITDIVVKTPHKISITFTLCSGAALEESTLSKLMLYFDRSHAETEKLYYFMLEDVEQLLITGKNDEGHLIAGDIDIAYLDKLKGKLGSDQGEHTASPQVLSYFHHKELFQFIKITFQENIAEIVVDKKFEITLQFSRKVDFNTQGILSRVKTNCVPVKNTYSKICEPITLGVNQYEYTLFPDAEQKNRQWIYSIDNVTCISNGKRVELCSYSNNLIVDGERPQYILKRHFIGEEACKYVIEISDSACLDLGVLSIEATVTDSIDDVICFGRQGNWFSEEYSTVIDSIDQVEKLAVYRPIPYQEHMAWHFLMLQKLGEDGCFEKEKLKKSLYMQGRFIGKKESRMINAIHYVKSFPFDGIKEGSFFTGVKVDIGIQDKYFDSIISCYLFCRVLFDMFQRATLLNQVISVKFDLLHSGDAWLFGDVSR